MRKGGAGKIRVGTASWSDPGFIADWYPKSLPASERLPYYAEHFNLVELNSSFYGIPARKMAERWALQTPADFVFDVKLHKLLSRHSAAGDSLPPDLRAEAEFAGNRVKLTPKLEEKVAKRFLGEIEPLYEAGKMGALLLQLSPSFSPRTNELTELDSLLDLLEGRKVAIELRNRNWVSEEALAETSGFFEDRHVSFVSVDAPKAEHFMVMPFLKVVTNPELAYVRLHGRDAEGFIKGKTVAERFNYDYTDEEVKTVCEAAAELAKAASETHIIYNNNASDYALTAAARTRRLIEPDEGGRRKSHNLRQSFWPLEKAH